MSIDFGTRHTHASVEGVEAMFKLNVAQADRWIRIVLGLGLLSLLFILDGGTRYIGLVGLIPLITGAVGFCPLYALFGFSTRVQATR